MALLIPGAGLVDVTGTVLIPGAALVEAGGAAATYVFNPLSGRGAAAAQPTDVLMAHLGDYDASTVIYGHFSTYRPSTGAAYTLGGTPALSVYKDNSATQSTSGVTLTADFDSVTGLNYFAIDTSADGTFYSAGSNFSIVITTGTVDSVSVVGAVVGSFSLRKDSALKPTTASRTLDVSAGGEAGVDWANVGSPTTTLNLSGTTVKTATDVETDTADIQTRLPAALVSGRIDASVGAMAAGTVTAAAIATDAIDADALAADAVAEIADAVWDEARAGHVGAGTFGEGIASVQGNVTGNVGGNVTGSVGSVAAGGIAAASFAANAIDAAALAADAGTEIGSAVWATATRTLTANTNLNDPTAAAIADAVWDEALSGHLSAGTTGEALNGASAPSAAAVADAVWDEARAGHVSAGSFGEGVASVQGNVTGSVASVTGAVGSVTGNVGGNVAGSVASVTGAVGSVTGNVGGNVVGSVGSLAAQAKADVNAEVDSALDTAIPGTPTAGSVNDVLTDLDARLPTSGTLSVLSAAAVNAEVVDALATDTYAEPGQGAPAATTTLAVKINYLYKAFRNKSTQTADTYSLFADDASTVDQKASVSDNGTTFTRGELDTGP